jgi:hypothetical protein
VTDLLLLYPDEAFLTTTEIIFISHGQHARKEVHKKERVKEIFSGGGGFVVGLFTSSSSRVLLAAANSP